MKLQTAQAIYSHGMLIFADPDAAPSNGAEVVVTYLGEYRVTSVSDAIRSLRGRGKGEQLLEKLLHIRHTDRKQDERSTARIRP